jgi:hypothetical protein
MRRAVKGGLLSALVTGAIQGVQIWVFPLFHYALPSMRVQALFTAASFPGIFGPLDMALAPMVAISLAFWFAAGGLIAALVRRNAQALAVWLLTFALVDALCFWQFYRYMTGYPAQGAA